MHAAQKSMSGLSHGEVLFLHSNSLSNSVRAWCNRFYYDVGKAHNAFRKSPNWKHEIAGQIQNKRRLTPIQLSSYAAHAVIPFAKIPVLQGNEGMRPAVKIARPLGTCTRIDVPDAAAGTCHELQYKGDLLLVYRLVKQFSP